MILLPICRQSSALQRAESGQALYESLLLTVVLVAGVWGWNWMTDGEGLIAVLMNAMRLWHTRFAAVLAIPV